MGLHVWLKIIMKFIYLATQYTCQSCLGIWCNVGDNWLSLYTPHLDASVLIIRNYFDVHNLWLHMRKVFGNSKWQCDVSRMPLFLNSVYIWQSMLSYKRWMIYQKELPFNIVLVGQGVLHQYTNKCKQFPVCN